LPFYAFPPVMHRYIRSTNAIESLFRNVRQRTDQIDAFTTETSCLTIVWAVMQDMCAAERGLSIPDPIGRNLEGGSWIIKLT
jgi:transposase-like protein